MGRTMNIGRKGIFGNPFRAEKGEKLTGKTLDWYAEWLSRMLGDELAAKEFYFEVTRIWLPTHYASYVRALKGRELWCPGCRERSCEDNVCHGSVLKRAIVQLNEGVRG